MQSMIPKQLGILKLIVTKDYFYFYLHSRKNN